MTVMKTVLALFWAFLLTLPLSALTTKSEDENKDGVPDRWLEMNGSILMSYSVDRNYDGEVDQKTEYSDKGDVQYEEYDFNYDGVMDDFYFYNALGELVRREIDSDYDSNVDIWVYLSEGIYVKKMERDTDNDGSVDWTKEYGK